MPLSPGNYLGRYEILSALGAGGMGKVYRARDTQLNRDVAIKVLLPAVAEDPDRLARLSREAQMLASLNHSNIAAIYGLEDTDGLRALVMELVEGPTLFERLARGPLPLDEALPIARQMAEALAAAHEQGIIHRDLKPANIKIRPDGTVKLLDFGLAKALDPAGSPIRELSGIPAKSTHATQTGIILGTAAYMSPEQAAGRAVDKRSDLWTFGVVLLEMLTGRPVFVGESVSHVLAAVLKSEPSWNDLPAETPVPIRRLLRRCLEKDRRNRIADAADARLEIEDALSPPAAVAGDARPYPGRRNVWPWVIATVSALACGTLLVLSPPWHTTAAPGLVRLDAKLGADVPLAATAFGSAAILSPNGQTLAFVGERPGERRLYVRGLHQLTATPIAGTESAESPFFSPDGEWLAYFADGKLKKVHVSGGAAVTLCDAPSGRGGDWTPDDWIVFQPNSTGALVRVSSAGGATTPVSTLANGDVTHRWPQVLPGGRAVLYTANSSRTRWENATIVVQPLPNGIPRVVYRGGYYGRYVPSGHLVFVDEGVVFAAPLDVARLELTRSPVPALEAAVASTGSGGAHLAISHSGTLAYVPRQISSGGVPIAVSDRSGKAMMLPTAPADWRNPQFSPDGRRLAVDINDGRQQDVWTGEWSGDGLSRLTLDPADDYKPVWTRDGRRVVFASNRDTSSNLYSQRADGGGEVQRLTESPNIQIPGSWHPSGRFLAFRENRPETGNDLMMLPFEGDDVSGWKPGTPTVFLATSATESEPMFSPDGRWLAYVSNTTGRDEVYVRPFPRPGGTWHVSSGGGGMPTWSRTRQELLYRTPEGALMAVAYTVAGDSFRPETPELWSDNRVPARRTQRAFDLHPDGERVAVAPVEAEPDAAIDHVTLIFNFFGELRRIAPSR
jgi:Tol biopolymer transport system component